jgi:hypothetical protein
MRVMRLFPDVAHVSHFRVQYLHDIVTVEVRYSPGCAGCCSLARTRTTVDTLGCASCKQMEVDFSNKLMRLADAIKLAKAIRAAVETVDGVDVADIHIETTEREEPV